MVFRPSFCLFLKVFLRQVSLYTFQQVEKEVADQIVDAQAGLHLLSFSCNKTRFSNNETHVIYLIIKLINLATLITYSVQNSVPRIQNSITNGHMKLLYLGQHTRIKYLIRVCRCTGWFAPLPLSCNKIRFSRDKAHVIYLINLPTLIKYSVRNLVPWIQNSITNGCMKLM